MICPMMHFYKRPSGSHGSRGNVIAFEQEIDTFAENLIQLPFSVADKMTLLVLRSGRIAVDCAKSSLKRIY